MRTTLKYTLKTALVLACVLPLAATAQETEQQQPAKDPNREFYGRPSYWNPYDQRGLNRFETSKQPDTVAFEGLRIRFGAGFTQQFQNLKHENTAQNNTTLNRLYPLQPGFMTSQANLFTDVQLADGIRLNLTTYLSTRHHNEAWVKGGYIQFDKLPFNSPLFNKLMEVATIKVGHYEVNYGDAHFRRPDGGHALQAPFIEGNIVDAFATEIGGEVMLQKHGLFGMVAVTNGMIKGSVDSVYETKVNGVTTNDNLKRNPSVILKGGFDKNLSEKLRVRGSGSLYWNKNNAGTGLTLYSGDRAGSHYQNIMEKAPAGAALPASTAMYTSGRFNPGFRKNITAVMLNGFVKYGGLELFGTYETANGKATNETRNRDMKQVAGDVLYRFGKRENLYVGGRYNTVSSELVFNGQIQEVNINRTAFAAGWFVTPAVLLKGEVVKQNYKDFPAADYRNGGKFNGYVIEAVVGF